MEKNPPQESGHWLNRNVMGLAVNRFLSDFGHEAGTAILPLFLTAIGAPALALGVIEGVSDGLSSFTKLFGGWLGDRIEHRRPWAALGYLITGITTGLYGLFGTWPWILVVRSLGWAGRGLRSPLHDAILTDSVPASARGKAFGFDEAADTAGAILGPVAVLVAFGLFVTGPGSLAVYKLGFWLASIPGILAALSILALVKETPHPLMKDDAWLTSVRRLGPRFRKYLLSVFVFGCGDFSHTLLILYTVQNLGTLGNQHANSIAVGLYAIHNLLYAGGAFPAGALADKYGKGWLLLAAYGMAAIMNVLLIASSPGVFSMVLVFAVAGLGYAMQQSIERAITADLVPDDMRSTGFGLLASVNGIGDLISSLIVGLIWTFASAKLAFCYSLLMTTLGGLLLLGLARPRAAERTGEGT